MKTLIIAIVLIAGVALGQAPTASLIQLIANPEKFDGKTVVVEGVTNVEFEGNAIYLSKEHWKHSIPSFGIWLDLDPKLAKDRKWANGLYCVIKATFRAGDRGHMGLYMGSLTEVSMFQVREAISPEKVSKRQKEAQQDSGGQPAIRPEAK
jgi:hypothetical protein